MNEYTASNGITVRRHEEGVGFHTDKTYKSRNITPDEFDALREFFRAEEDERLERWRWPELPGYLVYHWEQPQSAGVVVVSELEMVPSRVLYRDSDPENQTPEYRAARAYFDAHPEPKPWHDAEDGELWALTIDGAEDIYVFVSTEEAGFRMFPARSTVFRPGAFPDEVTEGRRIWPVS